MSFNVLHIRADFPILSREIYGKPLIYLDNGATTQKPLQVIEAMNEIYLDLNSNIHRGVHYLSNQCTDRFEAVREKVRGYINAQHSYETIMTKGTTEAINLVAFSFGESFVQAGDEIIVSAVEHHANIVPWQILCERKNAKLKVIPVLDNGELDMEAFEKLLSPKTKMVAVAHISNVLGTINPIEKIIELAHNVGSAVLIDAAQSIQHIAIDVQKLDCDFLVFSAHKMYGPTGIGILYGKEKYLDKMVPYQSGGEMIQLVTFEKTTYNTLPFKFEAGTPDYVGFVGLGAAIDYINNIGLTEIAKHEHEIYQYASEQMKTIDGIRFIGEAENRTSVISFLVKNIHPFDAGTLLDKMGIAVRTGHHCAQPLMQRFGIVGTVRASFAMYNTREEVDALVKGINRVAQIFG